MSVQSQKPSKNYDLDKIRIATPCKMSWDQMTGDDRTRHCNACQLNVYNIAGLSKSEAQDLLSKRAAGERVCVRLLRRHDGTIITKDCPVGVSLARRARLRLASVSASVVALLVGLFSLKSFGEEATEPVMMGSVVAPRNHQPPEQVALMGKIAAPVRNDDYTEMAGGISAPIEVEPEPDTEQPWNPDDEHPEMGEVAPEGYIEEQGD